MYPFEVRVSLITDLSLLSIQFLEGCVERTPDATIEELRTELRVECGVEVSEATIVRSMVRRGLSFKKVRYRPFISSYLCVPEPGCR